MVSVARAARCSRECYGAGLHRSELWIIEYAPTHARASQDIAVAVKQNLDGVMEDYGYHILQALVTDIDPDG